MRVISSPGPPPHTRRFEATGGNPPFIRYQFFSGDVRERAITLCKRHGVDFSGLASSWAPFLVASAGLLQPGGRMAFVVPAEIGHAPYAAPLLEYMIVNFAIVHVVAFREKLFPELSEDCWLLYADGFGGRTTEIQFTAYDYLRPMPEPPRDFLRVAVAEWRNVLNRRLRPYLMQHEVRVLYAATLDNAGTWRFKDLARIGIGYVTGNNDFFHLRPSEAKRLKIPRAFLRPSVRKSEVLPARRLAKSTVDRWHRDDDEISLLNIPKTARGEVAHHTVDGLLAAENLRTLRSWRVTARSSSPSERRDGGRAPRNPELVNPSLMRSARPEGSDSSRGSAMH